MACRGGCVTITSSYQRLNMIVLPTAATPTACVTSTPHTATVYGNALDMTAIACVPGFIYDGDALGYRMLGEAMLGGGGTGSEDVLLLEDGTPMLLDDAAMVGLN